MKLRDLILEARIFQNNFIKISLVEEELNMIFDEDETPKIKFDEDGMYIEMDNFLYRNYEIGGGLQKFSLSESDVVDEVKNIKKYYIEYLEAPASTQEETPAEAPAA
jgi:hypothetical protein